MSLMHQINTIARCGNQRLEQLLSQYDIKGSQVAYLLKICRTPGVSQEEIAKDLCVNKSNVTRQLASLQTKGFIARVNNEKDHRIQLVYPTEKAKDIIPMIRQINKQWNEYLLAELERNEKEDLLTTIEKIADKAIEYSNNHQE